MSNKLRLNCMVAAFNKGLSQTAIAQQVGIKRQRVNEAFRGVYHKKEALTAIADVLEKEPAELFEVLHDAQS